MLLYCQPLHHILGYAAKHLLDSEPPDARTTSRLAHVHRDDRGQDTLLLRRVARAVIRITHAPPARCPRCSRAPRLLFGLAGQRHDDLVDRRYSERLRPRFHGLGVVHADLAMRGLFLVRAPVQQRV